MPWCPGCSHEHGPRKRKCPECGRPLVKGPGYSEGIAFLNREWFAVRVLDNPEQAEMLKTFLESNGFEAAIWNGNGFPGGGSSEDNGEYAGERILVPAESASRAANLIRASRDWLIDDEDESLAYDNELMDDDDYECESDVHEILKSNGYGDHIDEEFLF